MQKLPRIIFAISLQPRLVSHQWQSVEKRLRQTIQSIRGSRNVSYLIVIACHDAPDLGNEEGKDIVLLHASFAPESDVTQRLADKFRKRRLIGAWVRSNLGDQGIYVMFLDADDLVHRDLANYVVSHDNRRSYLVTQGYRYDCRTGILDRRSREFHRT